MDIENRADIEQLVRSFYQSAFADPLLGPIFVDVAKLDLDAHLPVITDFWESVIFKTRSYEGGAFEVHRQLNEKVHLGAREFETWLAIWEASVAERFQGPNSDTAVRQARRFAQAFHRRLNGPGAPDAVFVADPSRPRPRPDEST